LPTQAFGFGTGLRTILLKNLPPATFFTQNAPLEFKSLFILCHKKSTPSGVLFCGGELKFYINTLLYSGNSEE